MHAYKYLGVVIDDRFTWKDNTKYIYKRLQSRMFCLRKLRSFNVKQEILQMFYTAVIGSIISFGISCWGGNVSQTEKRRLDKQIKRASGVVGRKQDDIATIHSRQVTKKLTAILADSNHPLFLEFDSRRIDRSGRFRAPAGTSNRYRNSFIPLAIQAHNKQVGRSY